MRREAGWQDHPTPEALFVAAANQAPVPIWVSGTRRRPSLLNEAWLRFTGRSLGEEFG